MHERHYLRVADQPMHEAIQTLYREDPISERQQRMLRPVAAPTADAEPAAWLGPNWDGWKRSNSASASA